MVIPQSQMNQIPINGVDLHYLDLGSGDPVVMVHGGGATDYRTWLPVVDRFAERYHLVVPCLRYHYPNAWYGDGSDYAPDTHAQDIAALIDSLGLGAAHIIGFSLGAEIALVLARDFPATVRTLALVEPPLTNWLVEPAAAEKQQTAAEKQQSAALAWQAIQRAARDGDYKEAARLFANQVIAPGAFDQLPEPARQRMVDNARLLTLTESVFNGALSTFSRQDARAITVPTLLLRGDSSPARFLRVYDELASCMPGAERALIPHASHLLHTMNPQAFSDVVLSFLARE